MTLDFALFMGFVGIPSVKAIYHCKVLFFGIPPMKEEPRENVLSRFRCVACSGNLMLHVIFTCCATRKAARSAR